MNDDGGPVATPSQTVGPFFSVGMTRDDALRVIASPAGGERIELFVTVTDGDGRPVPDAVVELWQTGCAPTPEPSLAAGAEFWAFGRMATSATGTCQFETVRPLAIDGDPNVRQARHINVCLFARGLLRQLHTRIYFPDDPGLDADPVLMRVDPKRRRTLFADTDDSQPRRWHFHIRLQGSDETVFFAV